MRLGLRRSRSRAAACAWRTRPGQMMDDEPVPGLLVGVPHLSHRLAERRSAGGSCGLRDLQQDRHGHHTGTASEGWMQREPRRELLDRPRLSTASAPGFVEMTGGCTLTCRDDASGLPRLEYIQGWAVNTTQC